MPDSILKIILRVTKEGTGNKELEREAKQLKSALSDLGLGSLASVSALGLLSGAVAGTVAFTKSANDETVKYAGEIINLSQVTGETAEETSRVVQVLDDFKLTTDDLLKAQKALAKEGLSLNIETLAKLSDQYRQLDTGVEKSQFLMEKFGKAGFAFADAMQTGGDALREMSNGISDGLIMTDESIQAAEDWRLAVDELNDEWMAFKITFAGQIIPELTNALQEYNDHHTEWFTKQEPENLRGSVAMTREYAQKMKEQMASLDRPLDSAGQSYQAMAQAMADSAPLVDDATTSLEDQEATLKELSKQNQAYLQTVGTFSSMYADHNQKMNDIDAERKQVEADLALARSQGWSESSDKVQGFKEKIAELKQAEIDEGETAKLKMHEKMLAMLEQQLAIGGLSEVETNYLLDLGLKWGVYSQEAVDAAKRAQEEINRLANQIITLPDGKQITIEVFTQMTGYAGYGAGASYATNDLKYQQPSRDSGGLGMPGQAYAIGTGAQPEYFIPSTSGTFVPQGGGFSNVSGGGGGGGSMDVNVNLTLNGDAESLLKPTVTRIVRRLN